MLSDTFMCPKCQQEKPVKQQLLSVATLEALEGTKLHFFCVTCGNAYQVSAQNNQYLIEDVGVE